MNNNHYLSGYDYCHFIEGIDNTFLVITLNGLYILNILDCSIRDYKKPIEEYLNSNPGFKDVGFNKLNERFPKYEYVYNYYFVVKKEINNSYELLAVLSTERSANNFIDRYKEINIPVNYVLSVDRVEERR